MSDRNVDGDQPGNRRPAPPPLDLVQDFVNSWDREGGIERFDSPVGLARWLRVHGLIARGDKVTSVDVAEATGLREALRQVLLEHNGQPADSEAHAIFARYADASPLAARLDERGDVVLAPARVGVPAAWTRIFAAIAQSSSVGTWPRLKACRSDICQWAFFDYSKNRSSQWCTMEMCGARAKMRRYRERQGPD